LVAQCFEEGSWPIKILHDEFDLRTAQHSLDGLAGTLVSKVRFRIPPQAEDSLSGTEPAIGGDRSAGWSPGFDLESTAPPATGDVPASDGYPERKTWLQFPA
jgi:hypothetical protein